MLSYDISAFNLAARALSLLTRGFELVTPGFKVTICRFELIIRGFKLITHRFELATHVLLFHNNTLYKITCIFFFISIFNTYVEGNDEYIEYIEDGNDWGQ